MFGRFLSGPRNAIPLRRRSSDIGVYFLTSILGIFGGVYIWLVRHSASFFICIPSTHSDCRSPYDNFNGTGKRPCERRRPRATRPYPSTSDPKANASPLRPWLNARHETNRTSTHTTRRPS